MADVAVDVEVAPGLLDKPVHHAETEAAAFAGLLRREERLQNPLQDLGRHPGSGVGDSKQHIIASGHLRVLFGVLLVKDGVAGIQGQHTTVRHRIPRVHRQIEQGSLDLAAIGTRLPQLRREVNIDVNAGAECPPQEVAHALDHLVQVKGLWVKRLAPGKCEQLVSEFRAALGGPQGIRQEFADLDVAAYVLLKKLQVADDDGQQVVEIVCDAASELADRLELVGLPELLIHCFPRRDVLLDCHKVRKFTLGVLDRSNQGELREQLTILLPVVKLASPNAARSNRFPEVSVFLRKRYDQTSRCAGSGRWLPQAHNP